jgi:hypothetical protein
MTRAIHGQSAGTAQAVAMPVFNGAAEVVELLRTLFRRPRIGELPYREQGERGIRRRRGLPMLCLVRPAGLGVLPALAGRLASTGQGRVPHAMITFPGAEPSAGSPWLGGDAGELEAVRVVLFALAEELGTGRNAGSGRIRFRRFGLANWLLQQDVRGRHLVPDKVLLRLLRERSLAQRRLPPSPDVSEDVQTELRSLPAPWWVRPLMPLLRRVPPLWFGWKASGRLPVFGADYRWFLRQPYLAPRDPGTFVGFAERLTVGIRDQEDHTQILKLLVNAFLEDLRRAYRRPPWRPRGARRTTYAVVFLDGIRRDNSGYRILKLVNDVRNETGAFDPLLLVSGSEKLPPEALDPDSRLAMGHFFAASRARRGYQAWCNAFAAASRARTPTAWYLPIRVPSACQRPDRPDPAEPTDSEYVDEEQQLAAIPPFAIDAAPWWARRRVLYPLLAVSLLVAATIGYGIWQQRVEAEARWQQAHCGQPRSKEGADLLASRGSECIGVTEGWFSFNLDDPELDRVLREIAKQNSEAAKAHDDHPQRPYITLVYLSGFRRASVPEGLAAQREALAGVAAMQRRQLSGSSSDVLVRILVANAGATLRHGTDVAKMLRELAARDSRIVGMVGLGHSRQPTIDTIEELTEEAGLPMMAAALSADPIAGHSLMYYQVSPQNRREAAMAARYARELWRLGRLRAQQVRIVQSNDREDIYSGNLADDVEKSFKQPDVGFTVERHPYRPDEVPTQEAQSTVNEPGPRVRGRQTCGFKGLVFYAGRTQEFGSFLDGVREGCRDRPPTILAGDDISNYVADPNNRDRNSIPFDYFSFAVVPSSCAAGSSQLYDVLRELLPKDCGQGGFDSSLNGHAALAYDATQTMVTAAQHLYDEGVRTITPHAVWHAITGIPSARALAGETGTIDFGGEGGQIPVNKAIAILRLTDSPPPIPRAFCGQHGQRQAEKWCPTDTKDPWWR